MAGYFNERQQTMFDTPLTAAADEVFDAKKCLERAKLRLEDATVDLIKQMKDQKIMEVNSEEGLKIRYKYTDAKESIAIKIPEGCE